MLPPAGTQIRHSDAVTVSIAAPVGGGASPPPQPIVTGTPPVSVTPSDPNKKQARITLIVPEGASKQTVKIVVIDSRGVHTVYEKPHAPGETIHTQVDGSGYTIVQVYIDNRLIQEVRP
jgi:hypothetical protein